MLAERSGWWIDAEFCNPFDGEVVWQMPRHGDVLMDDLVGTERARVMREVVEIIGFKHSVCLVHSQADICFRLQSAEVTAFIAEMEDRGHRKTGDELDLLMALPYKGFDYVVWDLFATIFREYPETTIEKHTSGPLIVLRKGDEVVAELKPVVNPLGDKTILPNGRIVLAAGQIEYAQMAAVGRILMVGDQLVVREEPPLEGLEADLFPVWDLRYSDEKKMRRVLWNTGKLITTAIAEGNADLANVLEMRVAGVLRKINGENQDGLIFTEDYRYWDRIMELIVMQNIMGYQSGFQADILRWLTGDWPEYDVKFEYSLIAVLGNAVNKMTDMGMDEGRVKKYKAWRDYLGQKAV